MMIPKHWILVHLTLQHDSFDLDGDGLIDTAEVSEPFLDYGQDGIEGTFDVGEGNGYWDGYSMINCEPVVRTDVDLICKNYR